LSYRDNIKMRLVKADIKKSFEVAEWTAICSNMTTAVVGIYRPPYSATHPVNVATFIKELKDYLTDVVADYKNIVLLGDFNLHVNNDADVEAEKFRQILCAFGLINHVNIPPHESGNSLDLIITKQDQRVEVIQIQKGETFSDHDEVVATLSVRRPDVERKRVKTRSLKTIDHSQMRTDVDELVKEA
jgi:hypothetical protein